MPRIGATKLAVPAEGLWVTRFNRYLFRAPSFYITPARCWLNFEYPLGPNRRLGALGGVAGSAAPSRFTTQSSRFRVQEPGGDLFSKLAFCRAGVQTALAKPLEGRPEKSRCRRPARPTYYGRTQTSLGTTRREIRFKVGGMATTGPDLLQFQKPVDLRRRGKNRAA